MSSGGGGGGGPQQVTSTVTQSNLPAYVQPYFEQVLQRGLFESARPYQPFGGQRLAQFAPEETFAQRNIMGLQRPEQIGMASDIAATAGYANMPSGMDIAGQFRPSAITPSYQATQFQPGYTPGQFSPGYQAGQVGPGFTAGSIAAPGVTEQYGSPYMQSVVEQQKRAAVEDYRRQLPGIGAAAVQAGAKGGTREALIQAEAARGLQERLGDIQATGSQAAFEQAQRAFEADRAARAREAEFGLGAFQAQEAARQQQAQFQLQAQQAGEAARQEAARMGLSAQEATDAARRAQEQFMMQAGQFNIEQQRQRALLGLEGLSADRAGMASRLAAAELLAGLGGRQQEMDLQRLGAMAGVGAERRGLMQRGLDLGYEDFLRQQAYGREQLGYLSNLLQGVPISPGSTVSTFGRVPSAEQQLLGSGLGALGLYQAFGGQRRG